MPFRVHLTRDAVRDLEEIYDYVERRSSSARARHVLVRIEKVFRSLSAHPQRGNFPAELLDIGIQEFRQVFFKPYRIIYRVIEDTVYVLVIEDEVV